MVNLSADEWLALWRTFREQSLADKIVLTHVDLAADTNVASGETARRDDIATRFGKAADLLEVGRVDEAIAASRRLIPFISRAVDQNPNDPSLRHRLALALAAAGDHEGYRRACAATLKQFAGSETR